MDSTNENVFSFGRLEEEHTWWQMTPVQADHFQMAQMVSGPKSQDRNNSN